MKISPVYAAELMKGVDRYENDKFILTDGGALKIESSHGAEPYIVGEVEFYLLDDDDIREEAENADED